MVFDQVTEFLQSLDTWLMLLTAFAAGVVVGVVGLTLFRSQPRRRNRSNVIPIASSKSRSFRRIVQSQHGVTAVSVGLGFAIVVAFSVLWPELRFYVMPETLSGTVTHVRDGDTIEVSKTPIRLSGVTCDERGTPLGDRATSFVMGIANGQPMECRLNGDKTYDRFVGRCSFSSNGKDLGELLVERGVCGRCARYDVMRRYAGLAALPFNGSQPTYCSWIW